MTEIRLSIAIIVRTSSSRLAQKWNAKLYQGSSLTDYILSRAVILKDLLGDKNIDLCLCTSTEACDDPLVLLARNHGVRTYRGSLTNVSERIVGAVSDVKGAPITHVVRLTGDNPLFDLYITKCLALKVTKDTDYLGALGCPVGIAPEIYSVSCLRQIASSRYAHKSEYLTYFISANKQHFRLRLVNFDEHEAKRSFKFSLDTFDDLFFFQLLFDCIEDNLRPQVSVADVDLEFLTQNGIQISFSDFLNILIPECLGSFSLHE